MDNITLLGLVAGTLTTIAFLPQLIKALKSRSTKDISLLMYIVFCIGIVLWLIYGILIDSLPLVAANAISLLIAFTILFLKIRYH